LVDINRLEGLWKPLNKLDASTIAANANIINMQSFVLNNESALLPHFWIMTIVVAAIDAWASSGPAYAVDAEDILGQHAHLILAKVFEDGEDLNSKWGRNYYTDGGRREKLLCSDIGFWRVHARDSGIDVAMASAIRSEPALSGLKSLSDTTRNYSTEMKELVQLLIWLLNTYDSSFEVSNTAVYGVAILLGRVGMNIKTGTQWLDDRNYNPNPRMRVVYLDD